MSYHVGAHKTLLFLGGFIMRSLIPRKELDTLSTQFFDSIWNDFFNDDFFTKGLSTNKFSYPKMNIRDTENCMEISAGVPGLTKDNVKVEVQEDILTISGENQNVREDKNGYLVRELHKSAFARSVRLDTEKVDLENISANVQDGMLVVKIPKKKVDKPKNKRIIEVA